MNVNMDISIKFPVEYHKIYLDFDELSDNVEWAMWQGERSATRYRNPDSACPYSNPLYRMAYIYAYHRTVKQRQAINMTKATANRRAGRDLWDKSQNPEERYLLLEEYCPVQYEDSTSWFGGAILDNRRILLGEF